MKINHSDYTISELHEAFKRKDIIINQAYQRSAGIWPVSARSYFIDTILEGFPFPKVYFYQSFDARSRKPIREVVDGQQRLHTIVDFLENKFALSSVSKNFSGKKFDDLSDDQQRLFLVFSVPTDVILAAEKKELLEMFRRMNAYTVPLNPAEKRHSEFQGLFKWFINELSDQFSPQLETYEILTPKQILRMADAEMLSEFILVLEQGIINKSDKSIKGIYEKYDACFPKEKEYQKIVSGFFKLLAKDFIELQGTFLMKPYAILSLFTATAHLKFGIPGGDTLLGHAPINSYFRNKERALSGLKELAEAHETQDTQGKYKIYVNAAISTTTKAAQRTARAREMVRVLL